MSFQQTVSLVETGPSTQLAGELRNENRRYCAASSTRSSALYMYLTLRLSKQKVRRRLAVNLQSAAIVPLDRSLNFLAVKQHDHHRCVRVDLLFVIEEFGIGLHRWRRALPHLHGSLLTAATFSA